MEELESSELGTQEYWENRYKDEIKHFKNHGDPGEIWFGEDIVDRIIRWLNTSAQINKNCKIVDVGCGNGMFLIELAREGYTNLHGIDYSEAAVSLAKAVAEEQNIPINYSVGNILECLKDLYDVIHDKGTYDAISLSSDPKQNRELYIKNVFECLGDNGLFIITSCNWTQSELNEHFKNHFKCVDVIPTPQFKFGGKVGNVVSTVAYKKN